MTMLAERSAAQSAAPTLPARLKEATVTIFEGNGKTVYETLRGPEFVGRTIGDIHTELRSRPDKPGLHSYGATYNGSPVENAGQSTQVVEEGDELTFLDP